MRHDLHDSSGGSSGASYSATPTRSEHIRRGTPGRDEELLDFIAAVEAMGKVGIPVLCYNLGAGGSRTYWVPTRGGAISSQFDFFAQHHR